MIWSSLRKNTRFGSDAPPLAEKATYPGAKRKYFSIEILSISLTLIIRFFSQPYLFILLYLSLFRASWIFSTPYTNNKEISLEFPYPSGWKLWDILRAYQRQVLRICKNVTSFPSWRICQSVGFCLVLASINPTYGYFSKVRIFVSMKSPASRR